MHTLLVLAIVAGVTLLAMLWVAILRHRVERQTRMIRAGEERLRDLAQHDLLTGLPNRLLLEERIAKCLTSSKKDGLRAAVLTIDIDRFKQVNDMFGHPLGDECLKLIAARLRSRVRRVDTIARTGGEEFTLVVGRLSETEGAMRVAENLLELFQDPLKLPGHEVKISISIGGALFPEDGEDTETLRKRSDQALYEAKRTGGNRAVFATPELCRSNELAVTIETALRDGLRENQFVLHYQPIYDSFGVVCRFEALLRTTDARLQELGPTKFIPVAEESGLILPLGRWVLEEACRQIGEWQNLGLTPCPVAVNVSARQLQQRGFADEVLRTLEQYGIEPEFLELELTETTVMAELDSVADMVAQLAEAGITFSIDDFGTGYSSLSRLNDLPIKFLKIDRAFVDRLEMDNGA